MRQVTIDALKRSLRQEIIDELKRTRTNAKQSIDLKSIGYNYPSCYIWNEDEIIDAEEIILGNDCDIPLCNSSLPENSSTVNDLGSVILWLKNENEIDCGFFPSYYVRTRKGDIIWTLNSPVTNLKPWEINSLLIDAALKYLTITKQFSRIK